MASPPSPSGVKPAVRAPAFRIEPVQKRERYLKLMIYGNYGVGKTTLACTSLEVESMRDVIMINAEAGDLAVNNMEGLEAITITDFRTLGQIREFLMQHCRARDAGDEDTLRKLQGALLPENVEDPDRIRRYNTVIMDSLTEIEAYCFNQLLGVTDTTNISSEVQSAEWTEYKKNHSMMLRVARAFRDLPMHVIFTAAEQFNQDENKRYKFSPDLTGKLSKKIQGFMDMVGYLAIGKGANDKTVRRLYVTPSAGGKYDAKHRYQAFKGEYFDDPSVGRILKEVGLTNSSGATLS